MVKALLIYIISLFAILGSVYLILQGFFYGVISSILILALGLFVLYFLVPFIVVVAMYLLQIPVMLAKSFIYEKAARKIASMPDLTVIGITGSYGKSSTKEFLAQILENKFKVIKTPKNINTEIGISKFILQKLNSRNGIFIVEMGAYKRNEIKRICDIVKPRIGIVTGINEQHLDLFKSFENIISTKYELIESLPKNSLAVFNGENEYCLEMAEGWPYKKIVYTTLSLRGAVATKQSRGITTGSPRPADAELAMTKSLPKHYLLNLAGAVEVAKYLGMNEGEIKEAVKSIKLTDRMMKTFIGRDGALVIDDSYSANPSGVLAGLDYLAEQKQKTKIVVMPCLIELGEKAEEVHRKIGKRIGEVCDVAIITTHDYFHEMKQEAGDKVVLAFQSEKVIELLKDKLGSDTAVLLEGRLAEEIVEFLK
jgi:UDP-N-acetylmuramoyl-tripeptide--D-alanyl-D-alanine ligase